MGARPVITLTPQVNSSSLRLLDNEFTKDRTEPHKIYIHESLYTYTCYTPHEPPLITSLYTRTQGYWVSLENFTHVLQNIWKVYNIYPQRFTLIGNPPGQDTN